jgi:hypothetical protein
MTKSGANENGLAQKKKDKDWADAEKRSIKIRAILFTGRIL